MTRQERGGHAGQGLVTLPQILAQPEAEVAELADALGSGPSGLTMPVEVQVLSSALSHKGLRR